MLNSPLFVRAPVVLEAHRDVFRPWICRVEHEPEVPLKFASLISGEAEDATLLVYEPHLEIRGGSNRTRPTYVGRVLLSLGPALRT